jgi:hypothetical protein
MQKTFTPAVSGAPATSTCRRVSLAWTNTTKGELAVRGRHNLCAAYHRSAY